MMKQGYACTLIRGKQQGNYGAGSKKGKFKIGSL